MKAWHLAKHVKAVTRSEVGSAVVDHLEYFENKNKGHTETFVINWIAE